MKLNGRMGVIDKTGKQVVPFKYVYVLNFKGGFAFARIGESYDEGTDIYIDKNGTEYYEP